MALATAEDELPLATVVQARATAAADDSDDDCYAPTQRGHSTTPPPPPRIAFTGLHDEYMLSRYRSIVAQLGGELEPIGAALSVAVTHVVVFPDVGVRPSAKSVWAALNGKVVLCSAGWLDASARRECWAPLASCSDYAVHHGIGNPLDGSRVHLTAAFRAQHWRSVTVAALLASPTPALLRHATVVDDPRHARFVFAADDEEPSTPPRAQGHGHGSSSGSEEQQPQQCQWLTWQDFLERVPGHHARRTRTPER